jgi:hypothetical protein
VGSSRRLRTPAPRDSRTAPPNQELSVHTNRELHEQLHGHAQAFLYGSTGVRWARQLQRRVSEGRVAQVGGGWCCMTSRLLMTLQVVVPPPQKLGAVPDGTRVIAPITSGIFEGPRLRGKVLPGGGDWTLLRSDGVLELDLRITMETDDGALIYMTSFGLRHGPPEVLAALARGELVDPSAYYFRTCPRFETSAPQYAFLNRLTGCAHGAAEAECRLCPASARAPSPRWAPVDRREAESGRDETRRTGAARTEDALAGTGFAIASSP